MALVEMQRGLDRPGIGSILFFILPIIVDSIFHNLFPSVFRPALQTCMQQAGTEFTEIRSRKRLDRVMQVAVIASTLASVVAVGQAAISKVQSG